MGRADFSPTRRQPEKPGAESLAGETQSGGVRRPRAPEGCGGCHRARAAPRAFSPTTHPSPGARTPRRAHVVRPRLLG